MFSWAPDLYAYAYEDGVLYAQSDKQLNQKPVKAQIKLSKTEKLTTQVQVQEALEPCLLSWHRIETLHGKPRPYTYRIGLLEAGRVGKILDAFLDALPKPEEKRAEARVKTNLKVTSNGLPGFSAVVLDISLSGLCLTVSEPISEQKELTIRLELDSDVHHEVSLRVRVCWSRPVDKSHRVGVTFVDRLNYQQYTALSEYMLWARKIEAGQFGANSIRG